jgi:D-alanyl-D-alanine carboxypeptidase
MNQLDPINNLYSSRALYFLLLIFVSVAQTAAQNNSGKVDDYIKRQMSKYQIPGLSLAVVKNGKVIKATDYGIGSVEFDTRLQPDTVFQLFSTSKIFAGVAIMQLVDDGKLSLDTPVTEVFEDVPAAWKKIRIRHLLTHTSGLPSANANPSLALLRQDKASNLTAAELIKYVAELPLSFEPGEKHVYGQSSYILAGMIVEKLSQKTYADFLRDRVFAPLGMNSTQFGGSDVFIKRRPPMAYSREGGTFKTWNYPFAPKDYPAAGLNSSTADLAKFFVALDAGKLLKPDSLEAMWSEVKLNNGTEKGYGLGWTINEHKGRKVVGHEGGGAIWAAHFPAEHLSIIVLCNLNGSRADEIQYGVADLYLNP